MTKERRAVRALIAVAVAAAVTVGFVPGAAYAADNGRWSVFPVTSLGNNVTPREYFILNAAPGQTLHDSAVIKNNTKSQVVLDIYPADAYNTVLGGGFALRLPNAPREDVGAWMHITKKQVVVPPTHTVKKNGRTVTKIGAVVVPFTIEVPPGASPGDHVGGFVTADAGTIPSPDQTGLRLREANAVRVYLRVTGPINPQLVVSRVRFVKTSPRAFPLVGQAGTATVAYTIVNSGNVRVSPVGNLKLSGLIGNTLTTTRLTLPEVLPGQSVLLSQDVSGVPALDRVQAKITLTAPLYKSVNAVGDTTTTSISWPFLAVLLVIAVLIAVFFWRRARHRRSPEPVGATPIVATTPGGYAAR